MPPKTTPGKRFRRQFLAEYDVDDVGGRTLLDLACACLDRIDSMESLIAADGLTATGSMAQPVAHPLLAEVRRERESFARLLQDLEPPPDPRAGRKP